MKQQQCILSSAIYTECDGPSQCGHKQEDELEDCKGRIIPRPTVFCLFAKVCALVNLSRLHAEGNHLVKSCIQVHLAIVQHARKIFREGRAGAEHVSTRTLTLYLLVVNAITTIRRKYVFHVDACARVVKPFKLRHGRQEKKGNNEKAVKYEHGVLKREQGSSSSVAFTKAASPSPEGDDRSPEGYNGKNKADKVDVNEQQLLLEMTATDRWFILLLKI